MKCKVLILSHMYPSKANSMGGIFVHNQARYLITSGCDIKVISPVPFTPFFLANNKRRKEYRSINNNDIIDGVPIIYPRYLRPPGRIFHAPSVFTMYINIISSGYRTIKEFKPQLIHAHSATPDGYVGLLLGRTFNIPVVVTLHGSDINLYPFQDRFTYLMTKQVLTKGSKIIAVSKAIKEVAQNKVAPGAQIEVVYNGVDIHKFVFSQEKRLLIRRKLGICSQDIILIFVGNIIRQKGVFEIKFAFSDLAKRYKNIHLIVVGDGPELNHLISKAKELQSFKRMHFVGRQMHKIIPDWMSAGDIFIFPSWSEGHPSVILEAMSCSLPVVATKVGGIAETVVNGKSGILIDKGDECALVNAIDELIKNDEKRITMGHVGRQLVEQLFSWEKNVERTLEIYRQIKFK